MVHPEPTRGHRVLPHTADVILEAWGPDVASCCEEAAGALIAVCVDPSTAPAVERHPVHVGPASGESLLLDVLDEVIFLFDTAERVPIGAEVVAATDGGLDVELLLAERNAVVVTGAVPKAISRSELEVAMRRGVVRSRFLVDL